MWSLGLISLLAIAASANPVERQLFGPSVTTGNGVVVGSTNNFVDSWQGIPFAKPLVGNLRLRPPQPVGNFGTLQATAAPRACPQFPIQINTTDQTSQVIAAVQNNPVTQAAINFGEDCLTLNIFRPQGTRADAKLPVVFWIFGGGFQLGWSGQYDFTNMIQQSALIGKPIIAVAVNYRVGGFGFLGGSDLSQEHSTNLGLRDQRLGLQWTADNIAAFGGDPDKVTIWGESAGAISACDHTIINGGDNKYKGKPLFRGAMMNSGSIVPAFPVTSKKPQAVYDQVVKAAGCSGASDRLACLRALDYQSFLTATQTVPSLLGYSSLDLSYLPRPDPADGFFSVSPEKSFFAGKYVKVPTIIGDLLDEGTLFALATSNLTTNDDLIKYITYYFRDSPGNVREKVAGLAALYPDRPNEGQPDGSPFGTGNLYNSYPQQKRLAAILGDITFTITRRLYLDLLVNTGVTAYSYMAEYFSGSNQVPYLGTFHGSDLLVLFNQAGQLSSQRASWYNYYISFIHNLNPNTISSFPPQPNWPKYASSSRQIVEFGPQRTEAGTDFFRQEVANYLLANLETFHI